MTTSSRVRPLVRALRTPLLLALAALATPASAQILVYGGLARDRAAAPGEVYEEVIEVHNPTDEPQQARLYLTDYSFASDGSNAYGAAGSLPRSSADWVAFAPPVLTVLAGESVDVTVTVSVPATLAEMGSYWSMLMVEAIPATSAESTLGDDEEEDGDQFQLGVTERIRYGIQIATHVGDAAPEVQIVAADLGDGGEGAKVLTADVANVGQRMIVGSVYVDVFAPDGSALGRLRGSSSRIYPGTSVRHRVALEGLEPGTYEALLVIDGGEEGVFGAQYTLEL